MRAAFAISCRSRERSQYSGLAIYRLTSFGGSSRSRARSQLSPKEYDLLRVLVQHAGKVLTHRFLLGELWDDLTDAQYLRVYVRQLRQKIEADPERPQYILTETGIGYRLRTGRLELRYGSKHRALTCELWRPKGVNRHARSPLARFIRWRFVCVTARMPFMISWGGNQQ